MNRLTVWSDTAFPPASMERLRLGLARHRLLQPAERQASILVSGGADPLLAEADIAFGQPDPKQIRDLPGLRWVHLTTAGYTRYDDDALRAALTGRGAILTNSSSVYDEPCAEHLVAMLLATARQLPECLADQAGARPWRSAEHRARCIPLAGQSALILGFGAIARRTAHLLRPFGMKLSAVRRRVSGDEPVPTAHFSKLAELLPEIDHVLNILPAGPTSDRLFTAEMFGRMKPGAYFYNIGRGTTVDQAALLACLRSGRIAGAYLDVTDPEPLPPDHPLWTAPNCRITPHIAGGRVDEFDRLVAHFLENLARFERGEALHDRIV